MSITDRRDREREEMRRRIMDAAVELINEQGYDKLSIRKIAAKIDYSPTTIYLYYKDRAEIIADMADMMVARTMARVGAYVEERRDLPVDQLVRGSLVVFVETLTGEPEMAKAVILSGQNVIFAFGPPAEDADTGIGLLGQLLPTGVDQGVFRQMDPENAPWMLLTSLLGFMMTCVENRLDRRPDFHRLVEQYVDLTMGGILP